MSFNFKKEFISVFLSAGVMLFSPCAFASGKPSQEKKPFKASSSERNKSGAKDEKSISSIIKSLLLRSNKKAVRSESFVSVDSGEIIESKQFSFHTFSSSKIILPQAVLLKFAAFSECCGITDISMPAAKEIGWFAFMGCSNLKNVDMPNVEEISCCVFLDCPQLERVNLKNVKKISNGVFAGCRNLKEVVISDDVSTVASDAFDCCSDKLKIVYRNASLSKEEFFKKFKGDTEPNVTIDEIERLFMPSKN